MCLYSSYYAVYFSIYAKNKQLQDIGGDCLLLDNIKALCEQRQINISTLETEAELGKNTVYKWNRLFPSVDKLKRVADFFGVTVDELIKEPS